MKKNIHKEKLIKSYDEGTLSSRRDENSLFTLTKKFIRLIYNTADKHINMTQASLILDVSKRRIYDITNVLECTGMLTKWSVNDVKWVGGDIDNIIADNSSLDDEAFRNVSREEKYLDIEINRLNREISELSSNEKNLENAYVTYEDLQRLKTFKDKIVFAVKVPTETKIEYPRYEKGVYRCKLIADKGQIAVYYVTKDNETNQ